MPNEKNHNRDSVFSMFKEITRSKTDASDDELSEKVQSLDLDFDKLITTQSAVLDGTQSLDYLDDYNDSGSLNDNSVARGNDELQNLKKTQQVQNISDISIRKTNNIKPSMDSLEYYHSDLQKMDAQKLIQEKHKETGDFYFLFRKSTVIGNYAATYVNNEQPEIRHSLFAINGTGTVSLSQGESYSNLDEFVQNKFLNQGILPVKRKLDIVNNKQPENSAIDTDCETSEACAYKQYRN